MTKQTIWGQHAAYGRDLTTSPLAHTKACERWQQGALCGSHHPDAIRRGAFEATSRAIPAGLQTVQPRQCPSAGPSAGHPQPQQACVQLRIRGAYTYRYFSWLKFWRSSRMISITGCGGAVGNMSHSSATGERNRNRQRNHDWQRTENVRNTQFAQKLDATRTH